MLKDCINEYVGRILIMIKYPKWLSVIFTLLFITGCGMGQVAHDPPEPPLDIEIVVIEEDIALTDLTNTEFFRPGALEHIFEGELNRKGDAVGFHYEGLSTAKGTVIEDTRTNPDKYGVYEAEVEVAGVKKRGNRGISSFFPIDWTAQDVVDAINEAYETKEFITGNTYEGLTEEGIVVHMYLDSKNLIISAFPVR